MVNKRHLNVDYLKVFVLDEADELMSRGFKERVKSLEKTHLRCWETPISSCF